MYAEKTGACRTWAIVASIVPKSDRLLEPVAGGTTKKEHVVGIKFTLGSHAL